MANNGLDKLKEVLDEASYDHVVNDLGELGEYITEFTYGKIYNRNNITLQERELVTIGIVAALGREKQIHIHIKAGLKAGLTILQIEDVIMQTAMYAGFPASIIAYEILNEYR